MTGHTASRSRSEGPPPQVRNVLLWRQARYNQATHDCDDAQDVPLCRFCGTPCPCDPRINADEALAASFSSTTLAPPPTSRAAPPPADREPAAPPVSWPKRVPRPVPAIGIAPVHPNWLSSQPGQSR